MCLSVRWHHRYIAPEVVKGGPYGEKVDLWSVGVVTFMLIGQCMPFRAATLVRIYVDSCMARRSRAGGSTSRVPRAAIPNSQPPPPLSSPFLIMQSEVRDLLEAVELEFFYGRFEHASEDVKVRIRKQAGTWQ